MEQKTAGHSLYQKSGVNLQGAEQLVGWLKNQTDSNKTLSKLGGFASLFELGCNFTQPVLVSSTDGVGTKLLLALEQGDLSNLGIDLVAMCVNDLYTTGAKPLFFLDYFATGALEQKQFKTVIQSIQKGLEQCQCPLLGGETAELPGLYKKTHFDLAGFVVGVVEKNKILDPKNVQPGDLIYGLSSSGFHSNGYSLIRSWLQKTPALVTSSLIKNLLKPTTIYHQIPDLAKTTSLRAVAHITGGGISGNLKRILPQDMCANICYQHNWVPSWMLDFFNQMELNIIDFENIFNLGTGLVLIVDKAKRQLFESASQQQQLVPYLMGKVQQKNTQQQSVSFSFSKKGVCL